VSKRYAYLALSAVLLLLTASACGRIARPEGWSAGVVIDDMPIGTRMYDALVIGTRDGTLIALDRSNGATLWSYELEGPEEFRAVYGTPVFANDTIYMSGYDGALYALTTEGRLKWREPIGDGEPLVGGPVLVEDVLLTASSDGQLYAFESNSGSRTWTVETGNMVWSTPVVADGIAYFGSMDHSLYAVNVANGTIVWKFEAGGGLTGAITVHEGRVYAGAFDGVMYALDAGSGEEQARFEGARGWYWARPVISGGVLYAPSLDGRVYGLDVNTLEPVRPAVQTDDPVSASPVVVGDRLVVPSDDGMIRLARLSDGGDVRHCDIGSKIRSLTVSGSVVYLSAHDKSIRALAIDSNGDPDEDWSRFTDKDDPEPSDRSRPC
jgi:outer membrane protein assembly factor BamB